LRWGDYILLYRTPFRYVEHFRKMFKYSALEGYVVRFLLRLPSNFCWFLCFVLLNIGWVYHSSKEANVTTCSNAKWIFSFAIAITCLQFLVCMLSFLRVFEVFAISPLVRSALQASQYLFVGNRPPPMLYVTDGGVTDCTAIVQLMRRQQKRILLVLAAADAEDNLGVLRMAMGVAENEKIGSFFDPEDPRRPVSCLLDSFKNDKSQKLMKIGIYYCWGHDAEETTPVVGYLYIVKNRMPHVRTEDGCMPTQLEMQAPLTVEEICAPQQRSGNNQHEDWHGLTPADLGSLGCCDCCHKRKCLNCGPKFPHGGFTGYLYLTPQWFNSLVRLGYEESEQVINELTNLQHII